MATAATFADLGVSAPVVEALADRGIVEAFPIQEAVIEAALEGRDLCGKAPTGSGKTLAFGVPAVDLAEKGTPWRPKVLILSPTRELASQIKDELEPLAEARNRSILTVFGGTNIERDINRLERGVDILVACPGRLEDLISRRCCELRDVRIAIVDEADRMADMGFLPSVKRILDQTADNRHMLLFSATLDGDVNTLIKRYQTNPAKYEVEEQADQIGDVEHSWYLIQPDARIDSAVSVLSRYYSSIVFCRTRRGCDRVAKLINKRGLPAVAIHGDRSQAQRERALRDFTNGKAQVLVATDVAARGIHVDNVALVMHYDPANSDKDYIHRSGRTGRAGSAGRVISMVVEDKQKIARQLQKELGVARGFEKLDISEFPDKVDRPKPKPERTSNKRKSNDREQRGRGDNRGDRKPKGRKQGDHNRDRNRNRNDRGDRDDRGGRGERNDRNERGGRRPNRSQQRRRGKKNDWYPPGWDEDQDRRARNRNDDDRSGSRSGGRGSNSKNSGPKKSGAKSSGPKDRGNQGRNAQNRSDRGRGAGRNRDHRNEDEERPGGSNTTPRKKRSNKGRHADRPGTKNKGKRRPKN